MTVIVKGEDANATQLETIEGALSEARTLGAGHDTMVACIMCMTQESTCTPEPGGDTSMGPYQQRDFWGPTDVRMSPSGSTRLFLNGGESGEPGWKAYWSIPDGPPAGVALDEAVQRVQVSAFPYAYGQWQAEAQRTVAWWLTTLTPPKSMHYDRYPKSWQTAIRRYDDLRTLEHLGRLTATDNRWLEHRRSQCVKFRASVDKKAIAEGSETHPNWDEDRGWMNEQLERRGRGLRAFPTA